MPHGAVGEYQGGDKGEERRTREETEGVAGSLVWSAARGKVRLRVRLVKASSAAAAAAAGGGRAGVSGGNNSAGDDVQGGGGVPPKKGKRRRVEAATAAAAAACRTRSYYCLPALVVVHRPGHFDSLQPPPGHVLVMEREVVDPQP
jgi:hypothetical protein